MKTRQELQKEVKALQKALEDLTTSTLKLDEMNDTLLAENKRLEIEKQNAEILEYAFKTVELNGRVEELCTIDGQNDILKSRLAIANNDYKELGAKYINTLDTKRSVEKELKDIKSLNLFQLIKWWYNAKN